MSENTEDKKKAEDPETRPGKRSISGKRIAAVLFTGILLAPFRALVRFIKNERKEPAEEKRLVSILGVVGRIFFLLFALIGFVMAGLFAQYALKPYLQDWARDRREAGVIREQSEGSDILVEYRVTEPREQIREDDPIPPLVLLFQGSAAKKEQMDQVLPEGIGIKPDIAGEWAWEGDDRLVFQPSEKWAIGETYRVSMSKSLFPSHIRVPELKFDFDTPPLRMDISSPEFYIDPTDATIKRVLATLSFNYPVDPDSVARAIRIFPDLEESSGELRNKEYGFDLNFNDLRTEAYITSEPVGMPRADVTMILEVDSQGDRAIEAADNTASLISGESRTLRIPGISSFVKITSLSLELIKNDKQIYDQLLVLQTKGEARSSALQEYMDVWQLPRDLPDLEGVKGIEYFRWGDTQFVTDKVLALSTPLKAGALPTELEHSSLNSFRLNVDPGKYIYIKIRSGAPFYGGYYLAEDYEQIIQIRDYPKELEILSEGNLLSLSGDKRLSLFSRGVNRVGYRIHRIIPEDINHLVSQSNGNLTNFYFRNYNFTINNVAKSYSDTLSLNMSSTRELQYFSLDMSRYLNRIPQENLRYGLFLLEVGEQRNTHNLRVMDKRIIMVSDLGLLVKSNQDGSRDLFVQSIASGRPVAGATVRILGRNGIPLVSRRTDGSGHVAFGPLDFDKNENTPTAFTVSKGEDLSFLPYEAPGRFLDYSSFDIGGVYGAGDPGQLTTQVFSDRGLYRPGDRVNGAFIIKAGQWDTPIGGTPLLLHVADPKGQTVHEESIVLSAEGFNEFSFRTEDYSPTGRYVISLYLVKERNRKVYLGGDEVKVEEFLPDRLKVSAAFNRSSLGWISPEDLEAFVSVRNLYGAPAAGHRVTGRYSLNPSSLAFSRFREYRFLQPERATLSSEEELPQGQTDEEGALTFALPLGKFDKATYRLRLSVDAYEKAGGRSVASEASVLVSPLEYLVGYKADGDMGYIHKGSERQVELMAIAPDLERISVDDARLAVNRIEYVSTLVKQPNGVYKYESIEQDEPVSSRTLAIGPDSTVLSLDTSEPGNYSAEILDSRDNVLNRFRYTVVGESNLTRSLNRSAELEIKLDKNDYEPGETIELSISAPYPGAGLITIERDKVYAHTWFRSDSTSTIQRIAVPAAGLEGNGYVTVSYIRSPDSDEIFMSPLSYGSVPFSLSKESRTQHITLDYPALVKPGEELPISYSSNRRGRIVIYAVDEGILQVSRYRLPDPLSYFFRKRALEVRTAQILDLILPEYSIVRRFSAMGGGGGEDMLASNLNPFKRKDRAPVVFWSGILDAGPRERTVTYQVPDYFNGSLRIMAVCVSADAVGSTESSSLVQDTFIIQPSAPLAVIPGDEFSFQATVANNLSGSGENAEIRVSLDAGEGLTSTESSRTVVIPEGKDRVVRFPVRVGEPLGAAELVLQASAGGETSRISHPLSIRPAVPYRTTVISDVLERRKETIPIERDMYPHFRRLNVSASYLPIGLAGGLNFFLEEYPYTCSEQLVSMNFPKLYDSFVKNLQLDREERDRDFARILGILQARQKPDGGFGMWTVKSDADALIDLYAFHFLMEAERMGRFVPQGLTAGALNRAEDLAGLTGTSGEDLRLRAYAVFLLTNSGVTTTRYLEDLRKDLEEYDEDWRSDLIGLYMASSYSLLQMQLEAGAILRQIRMTARRQGYPDGYHDRLSYLSQYLTVLSRYDTGRLKQVSSELLDAIAAELKGNNFTTFSASMALIGIQAYIDATDKLDEQSIAILQILKDASSSALEMEGHPLKTGDFAPETASLEVRNTSGQALYYQVVQGGFDRAAPGAEQAQGIEILREYLDEDGQPVDAMELGGTYQVRLRIRATGGRTIRHMAVVDLLPACIEPQRDLIRSQGNQSDSNDPFRPDYLDIREDRLVFYGTVDETLREYVYPVRAVYEGQFQVPPLFAEAMYDNEVWALQSSGTLSVGEASF